MDARARDATGDGDPSNGTGVRNAFGAFHFTIDTRSPTEQIDFLLERGYDGAMIQWPGRDGYRDFANHPAVRNGLFKINAVLFNLDLNAPTSATAIREIADDLAETNTILWTLVFGPKDVNRIATTVATVADAAMDAGVTVALYPHDETAIESLEESTDVLRLAARTNLKTSLHLCHEFKAGNRDRLSEVVAKGKDLIVLASINGTFSDAEFVDGWERGILPLDDGDFDVKERYLRPLLRTGYMGPIMLHTYGIKDAPERHFSRSMTRWQAIKSELATGGI